MKKVLVYLLSVLLVSVPVSSIQADPGPEGSVTSYFDWYPGWKKPASSDVPGSGFQLQQGNYRITGATEMKEAGEQLLQFLLRTDRELSDRYRLRPGKQHFVIPLVPIAALQQGDRQRLLLSETAAELILPYPVSAKGAFRDAAHRFSLFRLLHALIRANLAFGSRDRLPISSHAFRFVDGLSGFMALEVLTNDNPEKRARFLDILETQQHRETEARRFSNHELLARNANSEDTDMLAGLNQFLSGIGLTRNSDGAINPADVSSTADRIRVFQWIRSEKGPAAIREIVALLSRSSGLWVIKETAEDSFCREYIRFGCREKTIDGSRSDIVLQYVTGMNFAQLLRQSRQETEQVTDTSIPPHPIYGFDYPKAGGANENLVGIHARHENVTIDAGDILDSEQIATNGFSLELGIRDEAYRIQAQINYRTGSKNRREQLLINSLMQQVPQTVTATDLQIGSRILKNGIHSGWADEIGVYFHWKRLQVEWDTRGIPGAKTEREYINSGFYLLDIQKATVWQPSQLIGFGLNTDFQIGLVNQSGSTKVVRSEKYNVDASNAVLGVSLGPEIRFSLPSLLLEIRLGGAADYLWQPLDDKGGKSGNDNDINASQTRLRLFASLGILF